jgi:ABC-type multidrug transport system ATPase subunit
MSSAATAGSTSGFPTLDNLRYFAELYGVSGKAQRLRIAEVLELVGLTGREQERVEGYSRGMRQRLHIARGILHDPEVVFLDEPTIGVDPVGARDLRQTIADLVTSGKTVLLTTHYMFEADTLCDRIAVIAKGRIVGEGTPHRRRGHPDRVEEQRRRWPRDRDRGVRRRRERDRTPPRDRRRDGRRRRRAGAETAPRDPDDRRA